MSRPGVLLYDILLLLFSIFGLPHCKHIANTPPDLCLEVYTMLIVLLSRVA
jgi:hypothetical protein